MLRFLFLFLTCTGITLTASSQSVLINFKAATDTISRGDEVIYPITVQVDSVKINPDSLHLYTITFKENEEKSTLPKSAYSMDFTSTTLDKLAKEYTFYLRVKKDKESDRDRFLFLNFEITKNGKKVNINNAKDNTELVLTVQGLKTLNSFNYLAYIGTNFDLVDGIKAQNLFFATNLFVAPRSTGKDWGFTLTLYGNRTMTTTDTTQQRYTARAVPIGGDSARFFTEEATLTTNRVSDNLGASFSPLIRLWWGLSSLEKTSQLYYAPQFEFIWRRTRITSTYSAAKVVDSIDRANRPFTTTLVLTPPNSVTPINVYDVYLGVLGFLFNHENKHISVRVQASLGLNISYTAGNSNVSRGTKVSYSKDSNAFFFTRAWITEPLSGLTFGAEVSNTFGKKDNAQPYYNVTLSKAINLNALAVIFQPVATR
ncbi:MULTISPECIES: hypothetical protein [unclassified Chitinophaga]|uniref:hypothetical protein n=1 Tax=unclassified Chitinophaga TaxID=2619133 RepID=UPI00300FF755